MVCKTKNITKRVIKRDNDLKLAIQMAKVSALLDGYNHVIIENKQGEYSHSREYENCCPDWYGKIIGKVITYWKYGILKCRYVDLR